MFGKEMGQLIATIGRLIELIVQLRGDIRENTEQLRELNSRMEKSGDT